LGAIGRFSAVLGFAGLTVLAPPALAAEKVALVIGNGKYQYATALPNPANDAAAVGKALTELGFDVVQGMDLDRAGMEARLRQFLGKANSAKVALLFYAGHGLQVDGRNYLVPVDSKLESASDLNFGTVDLDRVLASLDDPARANIIVLDACRDNPLARSFATKTRSGMVGAGLAAYTALGTGTLIAFSTAPGKVAADGQGANSPFTENFVRHLRTPGLEVRQMLTRVRADVAKATGDRQVPWDNSSLRGDVYLAGSQPGATPVTIAAPAAHSPDDILWGMIKDSSAPSLFEEFLKRHEASSHAAAARARLEELKKMQTASVVPPAPLPVPPSGAQPAVGIFPAANNWTPLSATRERALKPGDSFKECDLCPQMVVVPAGNFVAQREYDRQRRFNFVSFAVGKFEVTFEEWDSCVADGGCNATRPDDFGWGRGKQPVINVSWQDAKTYAAWLSNKTGKTYRLIADFEWEYVARAGTTTAFWFGEKIEPGQANYNSEYMEQYSAFAAPNRGQPVVVGSFQPNNWGLHDVHGNVREWTEGCRTAYVATLKRDHTDCLVRIARGGSFRDGPTEIRSTHYHVVMPATRINNLGLRVARTLER
jgi:uncharacterized caspase-like protein